MDIAYALAMPEPHSHLFHVTIDVGDPAGPHVDFVLPVWTPGAYAVRDFPKNVQDFDAGGLPWKKVDKGRWRVTTRCARRLRVTYRVWAFELEVDTSHIDGEHGYVNGASVFMYVDGAKHRPVALTIRPPRGWRVTTGLDGGPTRFTAPSYDALVDCPTEIGTVAPRTFTVRGRRHRVIVHGPNNWDVPRLVGHAKRIVEETARLYGGLPYKHYLFLYHAAVAGLGGLEHLNSTALTLNPWAGRPAKAYERILEVTAHEFFHTWNVKRIRPRALGPFDYEREVYTSLLWLCEGVTSYYDELICVRAGLYRPARYLEKIAEYIQGYREKPSRLRSSLAQSSFDTWLWSYKTHPQNVNRFMSYYEKGALVAMCLDLEIRRRTRNRRSLDDVMRHLWREVASKQRTLEEDAMPGIVASVAGGSWGDFFAKYVDGTEEVPFESFLRTAGLELKREPARAQDGQDPEPSQLAWLGAQTRPGHERPSIASVTEGSPAHRAGLYPDDEIVAFAGARVDNQNLTSLLRDQRPGRNVRVSVFRAGRFVHVDVPLGRKANAKLALARRRDATAEQRAVYASWLRQKWERVVPAKRKSR